MPRAPLTLIASLVAVACLTLGPGTRVSHAAPVSPPQAHPTPHTPPTPKGTPPATPKTSSHASTTFAQRIEAHPELLARLKPLLPAGMTLAQAAQGFKNQGQFIAALHVAHNLNIPFAQLKAEMTGTDHDSLGQAIHTLMPTADAKAEARKAEAEAKDDVKTADTDRDDR